MDNRKNPIDEAKAELVKLGLPKDADNTYINKWIPLKFEELRKIQEDISYKIYQSPQDSYALTLKLMQVNAAMDTLKRVNIVYEDKKLNPLNNELLQLQLDIRRLEKDLRDLNAIEKPVLKEKSLIRVTKESLKQTQNEFNNKLVNMSISELKQYFGFDKNETSTNALKMIREDLQGVSKTDYTQIQILKYAEKKFNVQMLADLKLHAQNTSRPSSPDQATPKQEKKHVRFAEKVSLYEFDPYPSEVEQNVPKNYEFFPKNTNTSVIIDNYKQASEIRGNVRPDNIFVVLRESSIPNCITAEVFKTNSRGELTTLPSSIGKEIASKKFMYELTEKGEWAKVNPGEIKKGATPLSIDELNSNDQAANKIIGNVKNSLSELGQMSSQTTIVVLTDLNKFNTKTFSVKEEPKLEEAPRFRP